jgi:hypothetical protein
MNWRPFVIVGVVIVVSLLLFLLYQNGMLGNTAVP